MCTFSFFTFLICLENIFYAVLPSTALLLSWCLMNFSPERPNNDPKTKDKYKSQTSNLQPGSIDE